MCREGKKVICHERNVVYRHVCLECKKKGKTIVYTGMTSRTLYERAVKHEQDMRRRSDTSHAWTHVWDSHREIAELTDEKDLHRLLAGKSRRSVRQPLREPSQSISSKDETK